MGFFDDPLTAGFLGMAGGFAQAGQASRMPTSLGGALAQGGAGLMQGMQAGQAAQMKEQELQAATMQNQYNQTMMPVQAAAFQKAWGGGGQPAPFGGPAPMQHPGLLQRIGNSLFGSGSDAGSAGAAPQPGTAPTMPVQQQALGAPGAGQAPQQGQAPPDQAPPTQIDPATAALQQMQNEGRYWASKGDGRAAENSMARMQKALDQGAVLGQDGRVYPIPGATHAMFARTQAEAAGTGAGHLPTAEAEAQYKAGLDMSVHAANVGADVTGEWNKPRAVTPGELVGSANQIQAPQPTAPPIATFDPNDPSTAKAMLSVPEAYRPYFMRAAQKANVAPALLVAHALTENANFNPLLKSSAGAMGLMQVLPGTAPGVDLTMPQANLDAGAAYIRQNLDRFHSIPGEAAAYVAGPNSQTANYGPKIDAQLQRFGYSPHIAPPTSGPTTVQADPRVKETEVEGARLGGLPTEINKDGADAQQQLKLIDRTQAAMAAAGSQGLPNGKFTPLLAEAIAGAKSLGINTDAIGISPAAVGNQQLAEEGVTQLTMQMMHRLFPGRITDTDITRVGVKLADYGMDPYALKGTLDTARAQSEYNLAKAQSMNAFKAQNKTLSGWEPQFYQQNGYGPQFLQPLSGAQSAAAPAAAAPAPAAPAAAGPARITPPGPAIARLKANPGEKALFDQTFGPGSAAAVLGQQ